MTLVAPDAGEAMLLDNALKTASPEALILRLYTPRITLASGTND